MFKDKAYVCNLCRKVITYSLGEAGQTMPCPFCKTTITLPVAPLKQTPPAKKPTARFGCLAAAILLFVIAAAAAGAYFFAFHPRSDAETSSGQQLSVSIQSTLADLMQARVITIPEPAKVRGVDVSVAVTEVSFGCPPIYQAAIKRIVPTETPVCCVKLVLTNTGKQTLNFKSWRQPNAYGDPKKASLKRSDGIQYNLMSVISSLLEDIGGQKRNDGIQYSLVSFGIESDPVGTQRATELAPGASLTDVMLFLCEAHPTHDLELTLPCENLGGKGDILFKIPVNAITGAKD